MTERRKRMKKKKYINLIAGIIMSAIISSGYVSADMTIVKAATPQQQSEDNTPGLLEDDDFETPAEYQAYLKRIHTTGNYSYKIGLVGETQTYVTLTKYIGKEADVKIPSKIRGLRVKGIAKNTFKDNKTAKTITIADSIETISKGAFTGCSAKRKKPVYLKKQKNGSYEAMATVRIPRKGKDRKVDYKASKLTKVTGTAKSVTIKTGKKKKIYTKIYVSNRKKSGYLDYHILSFSSSDKKVVTVSKYGNIKGIKKGTATIKVKLRTTGKSYKIKVKVKK